MKRVIMIGGSTRSTDAINGTDAEVWSCNNLYGLCHAYGVTPTRWFELHFIHRDHKGCYTRRWVGSIGEASIRDYLVDLRKLNIPVYMQHQWPIIPKSVSYPLIDVLQRFPRAFFNNSFAYMLGLAIIEKFTHIEIYGLCSSNESFREYYVHRVSTEYFLGYAEALDIHVTVGHTSGLLKASCLYGYQEQPGDYQDWQKRYATDTPQALAKDYINLWRL